MSDYCCKVKQVRMLDETVTLAQLKDRMAQFIKERNWEQNHSPKNISMSIAIEAAELMEKFQFCDNEQSYELAKKDKQEIERELSDILAYLLSFANTCEIDISSAYEEKMQRNTIRYPVEKITGTFENYKAVKRSLKNEE